MNNLVISDKVSTAAKRDIVDLQNKINAFNTGETPEEAFRKFRLTRGVYGQRQPGVQMIRIKLPYGRITADQLVRIADTSDKFATGNLHATTRQDIQLHFVKLSDSPQLWSDLEDAGITLKEACGNTIRNVTASSVAGIDPDEPFDVTPITHSIFTYFLRNPINQDMGRKFKIAVSSSEKDSALAFIHDVGLIAKMGINEAGEEVKGFKVLIGGGLGAQPFSAQTAFEFLEEKDVIPFIEALLRVFDRHGERVRRHKARMKFLLNDLGLEGLMAKVEEERTAVKNKIFQIPDDLFGTNKAESINHAPRPSLSEEEILKIASESVSDIPEFTKWLKTNTFEQKQKGWYAVQLRVLLGDMHSNTARTLADIVRQYAADDIRVTVNQGYILRFIKGEDLVAVYNELSKLGLVNPGFDSTMDITTCPGTDTCNLAITSSYGITRVLEDVMKDEFPEMIYNQDIKIKISGCMNGCGQHNASNIGFHGSSIKNGKLVLPALQVLLGGGFSGDGIGLIGDKVIKVPAKRGPEALRTIFNDYESNAYDGEYFNQYYARQTKNYFFQLLKPIADLSTIQEDDYRDWDHDEMFKTEIGVGECASVLVDLVATTITEGQEKLNLAKENFESKIWADAIYHAYNVLITGAKGLLMTKDVSTNTQYGIINDFESNFGKEFKYEIPAEYVLPDSEETPFRSLAFSINKFEPTEEFATYFVKTAEDFLNFVRNTRGAQLMETGEPVLQELSFGKDS
ncbi:HEPN domain-containing protein [Dyadobacter frigoris]|uniref:HEPN domain-containing protein n=1 Tax=Dyadobacter frigoris TaxID=2576211 RepID=A0A4U6D8I4_9BACT|nr:HEPN domain-containing protein [Dyadobacter frigoris]TKT93076.1 HEPN domain-containing protein [Dyadobacter frigoris]GLU55952.1 ferredoxin--nitrite reductase [Dyadobacter frigoris]